MILPDSHVKDKYNEGGVTDRDIPSYHFPVMIKKNGAPKHAIILRIENWSKEYRNVESLIDEVNDVVNENIIIDTGY